MKYPTPVIIYDRKKKASRTTEGSVEIRITHERKSVYFYTGVKVLPKNWDPRRNVVSHPDSIMLNAKIDGILGHLKDFITTVALEKREFKFSELDSYMEKKELRESFTKFAELEKDLRNDIVESTKKNYRRLFNFLEKFKIIQTFGDLTRENIIKFDNELHKRQYKQTTIYTYHKFMKYYINLALKKGLITTSPYYGLKFDRGRSESRKYLTREEQMKIKEVESETPYVQNTKDLFLFQCYTGLSYAELERFDFTKMEKSGDKYILRDKRKKTGTGFHIVLLPEALEILKKHKNKLPIYTNQKYNQYLKLLAGIAQVKKNLTSHMGRHTFAVNAINAGIPIEVISRMLGHTNPRTTLIYAKVLDSTVEKAFEKLLNM